MLQRTQPRTVKWGWYYREPAPAPAAVPQPARVEVKPKRLLIVGINVPCPGESLGELNEFRRRYGLAPVEIEGRG